jgi:hypothetical protein
MSSVISGKGYWFFRVTLFNLEKSTYSCYFLLGFFTNKIGKAIRPDPGRINPLFRFF